MVFWSMTPYSLNKQEAGMKLCLLPCLVLFSFLAYFLTLKMEATFPPKRRLTFRGLHGVIPQKIENYQFPLSLAVCFRRLNIGSEASDPELRPNARYDTA
jgi:hypothetical protein